MALSTVKTNKIYTLTSLLRAVMIGKKVVFPGSNWCYVPGSDGSFVEGFQGTVSKITLYYDGWQIEFEDSIKRLNFTFEFEDEIYEDQETQFIIEEDNGNNDQNE